jgi:two-component system chemotaxis response regulator CheB
MIRVLIVEDSPTAREHIAAILGTESDIEVVGQAADGAEGIEQAIRLRPDVVTMDINMPNVDGHQATERIMAEAPTPIVVVTSVTREEMIHEGLDILRNGALEIVQKPSAMTAKGYDEIRQELLSKVRAVSGIDVVSAHA